MGDNEAHSNSSPLRTRCSSKSGDGPQDFTRPFDGSDVVFVVDGENIHAAKSVLKLASPRFKSVLRGCKDDTRLELPGIKYSDFYTLMEVLHPTAGRLIQLKGEKVYHILPLVEHYEITGLLEECEQYLIDKKEELRHLAIAKEHNFKKLESKTIAWASKQKLTRLKKNPDWGIVEENYRLEILESIISRHEHSEGVKKEQQERNSLETSNKRLEKESDELKVNNRIYADILRQVKDITEGRGIRPSGGSLNRCNSQVHTHHVKGSMPLCVNCRSEMFVMITKTLAKSDLS